MILGIDPSLRHTGWAVLNGETLFGAGQVDTTGESEVEIAAEIVQALGPILTVTPYWALVIERNDFHHVLRDGGRAAEGLGFVRGLVIGLVSDAYCYRLIGLPPIWQPSAVEVRRALTGRPDFSGTPTKQEIIANLKLRLPGVERQMPKGPKGGLLDGAWDALACAVWGYHKTQQEEAIVRSTS